MGAPRKEPGPKTPPAVREICLALIELLDRAQVTNKQVIADAGLKITPQTFSRHLRGERTGGPTNEVITAVVVVTAHALSTTVDTLLCSYPPLRAGVTFQLNDIAEPIGRHLGSEAHNLKASQAHTSDAGTGPTVDLVLNRHG